MYKFDEDLAVAKKQLIEYVKQLHENPNDSVDERNLQVETLTKEYVEQTGQTINDRTLSYLADYILIDILKSKKKNKPIKTMSQLKRKSNTERQLNERKM